MNGLTFKAMGTDIECLMWDTHGDDLSEFLRASFEEYEQRFSRFRLDSELSCLNRDHSMVVSESFWELFMLAKRFYEFTDSAFNPLLSVSRLGYVNSYEKPDHSASHLDDYNIDFNAIVFDESSREIHLQAGQQLDFGGIAKGYAVDKIVQKLRDKGYENFLLNAGGDLYASGSKGDQAWLVGLKGSDELFELKDSALATSGRDRRFWQGLEGEEHHHILDVSTGDSAKDTFLTLTVFGDSVAFCDVMATAAFSMGEQKGESFLKTHSIPYLAVPME